MSRFSLLCLISLQPKSLHISITDHMVLVLHVGLSFTRLISILHLIPPLPLPFWGLAKGNERIALLRWTTTSDIPHSDRSRGYAMPHFHLIRTGERSKDISNSNPSMNRQLQSSCIRHLMMHETKRDLGRGDPLTCDGRVGDHHGYLRSWLKRK